nr:lysozyme inhibitor LprI family protein [Sphingomonas bacterium]
MTGVGNSPPKVVACNGAEIERQDLRLNEAYRIVMARLNPQQRVVLRDYERRWLALRDRQCAQEAVDESGALGDMGYSRCILVEVASRREWVENYRP